MMRTATFALLAFGFFIGLQGCVGTSGLTHAGSLKTVPLFNANSQPRFIAYLACQGIESDAGMQCVTVTNAFRAWANARHIKLKVVDKDAGAMHAGKVPAASDKNGSTKPYRLAILIQPVVLASYRSWSGTSGTGTSGYVPGKAGYNASVKVFSSTSGALAEKFSSRPRTELPQHANVTPTVNAEVEKLITRIDPAYTP